MPAGGYSEFETRCTLTDRPVSRPAKLIGGRAGGAETGRPVSKI